MVTLQSAENALKSYYLGVVADQLNTAINPLLSKIRQSTTDVWGKEVRKMAPYGVNGGISAGTEDGDLPTAASNNYVQFVSGLKNLYGKIEITDKALRASQNNAGAFVNLLNAEMEGLIKAASFNFGRMLFGDGSGKLCEVEFISGAGKITYSTTRNVMEGQVVDFVRAGSVVASGYRITFVDRTNNEIAFDKTLTGVQEGDIMVLQGSYNNEITGLGAIFAGEGCIYGLNKADYSWLTPYTDESTNKIDDLALQALVDTLQERAGSEVDIMICSAGVRRAYIKEMMNYKRNVDTVELKGGYRAISFNGIPLVADRFCPGYSLYALDSKDFVFHQLCDWKWLEGEEGKILRQLPNKPVYTATLVKYTELMCDRIYGQGRMIALDEA